LGDGLHELVAVHGLLGEQQQQGSAHVAALGSPAAWPMRTTPAGPVTARPVRPCVGVVTLLTGWTAVGCTVAVPV
ncbi:MAG: hypothetical protein ACRDR6_30065, partial [Pseudonocardiaceae bacterium]